MSRETLVWYDIKRDEIFLDWLFDYCFFSLTAQDEEWYLFECLGPL